MNRDKQIEEMAKDVTRSICWCNEEIPSRTQKEIHGGWGMKNKVCESYCGSACVDGRCPIALYYEDFTMFERKPSCKDCFYYNGCEGCAFKDMHLCPKYKKESEDTE